jgi:hypothetical protein
MYVSKYSQVWMHVSKNPQVLTYQSIHRYECIKVCAGINLSKYSKVWMNVSKYFQVLMYQSMQRYECITWPRIVFCTGAEHRILANFAQIHSARVVLVVFVCIRSGTKYNSHRTKLHCHSLLSINVNSRRFHHSCTVWSPKTEWVCSANKKVLHMYSVNLWLVEPYICTYVSTRVQRPVL